MLAAGVVGTGEIDKGTDRKHPLTMPAPIGHIAGMPAHQCHKRQTECHETSQPNEERRVETERHGEVGQRRYRYGYHSHEYQSLPEHRHPHVLYQCCHRPPGFIRLRQPEDGSVLPPGQGLIEPCKSQLLLRMPQRLLAFQLAKTVRRVYVDSVTPWVVSFV